MTITIAYDIDDVALETYKPMSAYLNRIYGDINPYETHNRYTIESKHADAEEIWNDIIEFLSSGFLTPLNNSFEYIIDIFSKTNDAEVLFITHRKGGDTIEMSYKNIEMYMNHIPFKIIQAISRPKEYYLKKHGVEYFVDDRFKNCNEIAPHIKHVFCMNRPWNMGREFDHKNITRIDSIKEVYDFIF